MIQCPQCMHKEMVGAVFCSQCGTQLVTVDGIPTTIIQSSSVSMEDPSRAEETKLRDADLPNNYTGAAVGLHLMNSKITLSVSGEREEVLGRVSEGQPINPDIDLTPYGAFEAGVSRMHASIKKNDGQILVTDLGSANGTRVNGVRITPHVPQSINHGDILTLGKFKIQVIIYLK